MCTKHHSTHSDTLSLTHTPRHRAFLVGDNGARGFLVRGLVIVPSIKKPCTSSRHDCEKNKERLISNARPKLNPPLVSVVMDNFNLT